MLTAYRETPHPATGVAPYEAMNSRHIKTKLDAKTTKRTDEEAITKRDKQYKNKIRDQKQKANIRTHNLIRGDCVLIKQKRTNKWTLPYEPTFYTVIKVMGSTVTARRVTDGRIITRDGSHFKLANMLMTEDRCIGDPTTDVPDEIDHNDEAWREQIMQMLNLKCQNDRRRHQKYPRCQRHQRRHQDRVHSRYHLHHSKLQPDAKHRKRKARQPL